MVEITETAKRIAFFGARKMDGSTYSYKPVPGTEFLPVEARFLFLITKIAEKVTYKVNVKRGTCNCPFCLENNYCKHIEYIRSEIEWEASVLARYEEPPIDRIA